MERKLEKLEDGNQKLEWKVANQAKRIDELAAMVGKKDINEKYARIKDEY